MSYLVYCILKAPVAGGWPASGVLGRDVFFVTARGLAAAVSEAASLENAPPVAELLAYGRVVEELFSKQAVVPLRYGCFLEGLPAVQRILEEGERPYAELLNGLDGCVEMGVRLLFPEGAVTPTPTPFLQETKPVDGGGYLAQRRAHYRLRDEDTRQHQALLDRYVQAFAGLHCKHRAETATRDGSVVLSLSFLIPKIQVDRFRETFRQVAGPEGVKSLLSGPWPPYNFATPEALQ